MKISPRGAQRIVDRAGVLSAAAERRIVQKLKAFEAATTGQMAIFIIPSLDGEPIETLGIRLAEAWKLGSEDADNGAILLIATKDRKMRLEIGIGWEGEVNDARAGDVIRAMGPAFRGGDYEGGIALAIASLQSVITGKAQPPRAAPRRRPRGFNPFFLIFGLWIIVILSSAFRRARGYTTYGSRGRRRYGGYWGGGFGGGGSFGGGGGFSGGGGSFGGGGASGGW